MWIPKRRIIFQSGTQKTVLDTPNSEIGDFWENEMNRKADPLGYRLEENILILWSASKSPAHLHK